MSPQGVKQDIMAAPVSKAVDQDVVIGSVIHRLVTVLTAPVCLATSRHQRVKQVSLQTYVLL